MLVILPADHAIPDSTAFCESLQQAAQAAAHANGLMTLGVQPSYPATGYGYIKVGDSLAIPAAPLARQALQFIEKPPGRGRSTVCGVPPIPLELWDLCVAGCDHCGRTQHAYARTGADTLSLYAGLTGWC